MTARRRSLDRRACLTRPCTPARLDDAPSRNAYETKVFQRRTWALSEEYLPALQARAFVYGSSHASNGDITLFGLCLMHVCSLSQSKTSRDLGHFLILVREWPVNGLARSLGPFLCVHAVKEGVSAESGPLSVLRFFVASFSFAASFGTPCPPSCRRARSWSVRTLSGVL